MDADSRRAVEVIRRGSNESIKEAISVLLGFDLEQALIDVLNDIRFLEHGFSEESLKICEGEFVPIKYQDIEEYKRHLRLELM